MTKKQLKLFYSKFLQSCNPKPRQFYGSKMLANRGKLILREPKNIRKIELVP